MTIYVSLPFQKNILCLTVGNIFKLFDL